MKKNPKRGPKKSKDCSKAAEPSDNEKVTPSPVKKKARLSRKKSRDEPLSQSTRTTDVLESPDTKKKLIPTFGKKKPTTMAAAKPLVSSTQDISSEESHVGKDTIVGEKHHSESDAKKGEDDKGVLSVTLKDTDIAHSKSEEVNKGNAGTNNINIEQVNCKVPDGHRSTDNDVKDVKTSTVSNGRESSPTSSMTMTSEGNVVADLVAGNIAENVASVKAVVDTDVIGQPEAKSDQGSNKTVHLIGQGVDYEGQRSGQDDDNPNKTTITEDIADGGCTSQTTEDQNLPQQQDDRAGLSEVPCSIPCQERESGEADSSNEDEQCPDKQEMVAIPSTSKETSKICSPIRPSSSTNTNTLNIENKASGNEDHVQEVEKSIECSVMETEDGQVVNQLAGKADEDNASSNQIPKVPSPNMPEVGDERRAIMENKASDNDNRKSSLTLKERDEDIGAAVQMEVQPQSMDTESAKELDGDTDTVETLDTSKDKSIEGKHLGESEGKENKDKEMLDESDGDKCTEGKPLVRDEGKEDKKLKIPDVSDDTSIEGKQLREDEEKKDKSDLQTVVTTVPSSVGMQGATCDEDGDNRPECTDALDDDMMDFTFSQVCQMEEQCLRIAKTTGGKEEQNSSKSYKDNQTKDQTSVSDGQMEDQFLRIAKITGAKEEQNSKSKIVPECFTNTNLATCKYNNAEAVPSMPTISSNKLSPYDSSISAFKPMSLAPGPSYALRTEDHEATKVVRGVIDELKGLNQMIMGAKKQIETARRQRQQKQQQQQFRQHNLQLKPRQGYQQQKTHTMSYDVGRK